MVLISLCRVLGVGLLTVLSVLWLTPSVSAQKKSFFAPDSSFNRTRFYLATGTVTVSAAGMYTFLAASWYGGLPRGSFHFFDDLPQWKQMDKLGHALGAYQQSRAMTALLKWSGVKRSKAVWWGGLTGFFLQTPIEILDGFSPKWGASGWDAGFNALGSGLCIFNELAFNEQRIQMKFLFYPSALAGQYPDKLGKSFAEQMIKDYNGQSYWLSFRVHSFLPEGKFKQIYPRWLNLAVGYGAGGLVGGYGREAPEIIEAREYRRILLSLDIDLSNIKTRSAFLKALLGAANVIRLPLPALEWKRGNVGWAWG